jgi:hypothetical protein
MKAPLAFAFLLVSILAGVAGCDRTTLQQIEEEAHLKAGKAYGEAVHLHIRNSNARNSLIDAANRRKRFSRTSLATIKHDVDVLDGHISSCESLATDFDRLYNRPHDLLWETDFNRLYVQIPEYRKMVERDERYVQALVSEINAGHL